MNLNTIFHMKIPFYALFLPFLLLAIPFSTSLQSQESFNENTPVSIIVRNSDGQLIAYIEKYQPDSINRKLIEKEIFSKHNSFDGKLLVDGEKYEVFSTIHETQAKSEYVISNSRLAILQNDVPREAIAITHDGLPLVSGDGVTSVWNFIRPVS